MCGLTLNWSRTGALDTLKSYAQGIRTQGYSRINSDIRTPILNTVANKHKTGGQAGVRQKSGVTIAHPGPPFELPLHVPLCFQGKTITGEPHAPDFLRVLRPKFYCHARYLVNNCHGFQSGLFVAS